MERALTTRQFWNLVEQIGKPGHLLGTTQEDLVGLGPGTAMASRITNLLARATALAFESGAPRETIPQSWETLGAAACCLQQDEREGADSTLLQPETDTINAPTSLVGGYGSRVVGDSVHLGTSHRGCYLQVFIA